MGRRAAAIQADVGKTAEAARLVDDAVAALGSLDILVNNAGIEKNASFADVTEADYRAVIEVNIVDRSSPRRRSCDTGRRLAVPAR